MSVLRTLFLLLSLATGAWAQKKPATPPTSPAKAAITAALAERDRAFAARDATAYFALCTADYVHQDALEEALKPFGGFDHNAQTLRTLTWLESPYPRWRGLNLSWELLEGLAKHNGPVADPGWALSAVNAERDLDLGRWPSLEAQIASVADDIAYDNHDIDDGIRAGLLTIEQLAELPFITERWQSILTRYPDVNRARLVSELIREQIGIMVNDVIDATRESIADHKIQSVEHIHNAAGAIGGFSANMAEQERSLKRFMYENLYHHPEQNAAADDAKKVVGDLFAAYSADPLRLPPEWRDAMPT